MTNALYTSEYKYLISQLKKARIDSSLDQTEVAKLLKKTNLIFQKLS